MSEVSEVVMGVIALAALLAPVITAYYAKQIRDLVREQRSLKARIARLPCILKPKGGGR